MAIYPIRSSAPSASSSAPPINIEAWAAQAATSVPAAAPNSAPAGARTSAPLSIPLDEHPSPNPIGPTATTGPETPRRPLLRRDSLDRRNALLKGKEGSRRRQRWENDHLLSNPHAQPPLPSDFLPLPTHPHRQVPYFLAPLWDTDPPSRLRSPSNKPTQAPADPALAIPHTLRATLKRARAARGLLRDLETEIRAFVAGWECRRSLLRQEGFADVGAGESSEDEEVVFVGRGGRMLDVPASPRARYRREEGVVEIDIEGRDEGGVGAGREKLVFDSLADDQGASFGRWLVHSIATYYDLRTWSVTVGDPARREAYVGIKLKAGGKVCAGDGGVEVGLPRPLWGMV